MVDTRLLFDAFSAVLLFVVAVLGSWLPLHLRHGSSKAGNSKAFAAAYHLGNCLSAGVMLSAGFCHLLADSLKGLAFVGRFPMATFLAAVGYLITLAADQVVNAISDRQSSQSGRHSRHGGADVELAAGAGAVSAAAQAQRARESEKMPLLEESEEAANGDDMEAAEEGAQDGAKDRKASRSQSQPSGSSANGYANISVSLPNGSSKHHTGSQDAHHTQHHRHGSDDLAIEENCGHLDVLLASDGPKLNFATAVLLAVALCVHSFLEGMALGAQKSMRATEDIMLAIAAHKGLAAYALGSSVVESGADVRKFWTVALSFSSATPIAIFVGYGLSEVSSGQGGEALSALASGTFLYVAMMEVIPRELTGAAGAAGPRWMRPAKLASLLFGFGAMSLLAIWA